MGQVPFAIIPDVVGRGAWSTKASVLYAHPPGGHTQGVLTDDAIHGCGERTPRPRMHHSAWWSAGHPSPPDPCLVEVPNAGAPGGVLHIECRADPVLEGSHLSGSMNAAHSHAFCPTSTFCAFLRMKA